MNPALVPTEEEKAFQWMDRDGIFLQLSEMPTKRLFYTWLMIWNHSCPVELQYWFKHKYVFSEFYTPQYMLTAFRALYFELIQRTDIGPRMKRAIEDIVNSYLVWIGRSNNQPITHQIQP